MKQQHDEISVWDIILFLKDVIKKSKVFLKRTAIFWALTLGVLYSVYIYASKKYISDIYISARNMNRQELTSQVLYLNSLIGYNNIPELATSLQVTPAEASTITKFIIEPYRVDESLQQDEAGNTKDVNESKITVHAKDNKIFAKLNNTLVPYLNNSKYSELLNTSQSYQLQTLINTYSSEILRLDSIESRKNVKYKFEKDEGLNFLFDGPSEVAKARISLIEKIAQTDRNLKTDIGVKVIKQFYFPSKPQRLFTYVELILIYPALVLLTAFILGLTKIFNDKMNSFLSKNN